MQDFRKDKFFSRFSDNMNYASRDVYIPEIHLEMDFNGLLDVERLERSFRLAMDAEPVLGCRFVPRWIRPYWERLSGSLLCKEVVTVVEGKQKSGVKNEMMGQRLDAEAGPQVKGLIIRWEKDRLILKVSHLAVDAGGAKQLAYLLADTYRRLGENADYRPAISNGTRSLKQVARQFNAWQLFSAYGDYLRLLAKSLIPRRSVVYPSGKEREGRPIFVIRTLDEKKIAGIREYGAKAGATINDMLVAAYFRALAWQTEWKKEVALRQMATVDLRRYLPGDKDIPLCNLSCDFWVNLGFDLGEDFDQTLAKVKAIFDAGKNRYLGWDFMLGSYLLIGALPYALKAKAFAKTYQGMVENHALPPAMTNLGVLDQNRLDFGKLKVEHAMAIVPACLPPAFAMGVSGFNDRLDFSAGFFESAISRSRVEELFDLIEKELPG